jgi:hypothetical protein
VGHKSQLNELFQDLDFVNTSQHSSIRFLNGEYGCGKTMLTSYLMELALEKNFSVAQVIIDPGVQLGNFQDVYRAFCQNLRTPHSGDGSGIMNILDSWSYNQLRKFQRIEGIEGSALTANQVLVFSRQLENELVAGRNLDPSLSRAIASFATAKVEKNNELSKYALEWIRASDKIPASDYSRKLGLKGKIDRNDAYNFLRGLFVLIHEAGFAGTLRRLPNKHARQKAYEIIRHILDDSAAGKFESVLFLITATPEFFDNRQGINEYPALAQRISSPQKVDEVSSKQAVLKLDRMGIKELEDLAEKIRKIHGEVEEWNINEKAPDSILPKLTSYLAETFAIKETDPRSFIRELINVFDTLLENPEKKIADLIPDIGRDIE